MSPKLMADTPSIVLVGGFDPRRFHPLWLREHGLLGETDANSAEVKVMLSEVVEWSTEWLMLQVVETRIFAQAKTAASGASLRDLVLGILGLLDQAIVTAIGINRAMHWDVGGVADWHKVGDALAPKRLWEPHLTKRPGLRTLQIEDSERSDGLPGKVLVTVQSSSRIANGIFIDVNNELVMPPSASDPFPKPWAAATITQHWERLSNEAEKMAGSLLKGALA